MTTAAPVVDPIIYNPIIFCLLSIERILYAYVFFFPKHFMESCMNGKFGSSFQKEDKQWMNFMKLSCYSKIFQVSVFLFDIVIQNSFCWSQNINSFDFILGLTLIVIGQGLNSAAYKALGAAGIYYGYEMGYKLPHVTTFPYNLGISDPQYVGVLMTVWGIYIGLGVQSYTVPYMEVFWYGMSMKILENPRGRDLLLLFGIKPMLVK